MKLIATVQSGYDSTFLIEAKASEIAKVMGLNYSSEISPPLKIGCQIPVGQAWEDLAEFRKAAARIGDAAEILTAVATLAKTATAAYLIAPQEEEENPFG